MDSEELDLELTEEQFELEQFLEGESVPFALEGVCYQDLDENVWYVQTSDGLKELTHGDYVSKSVDGEFDLVTEEELETDWRWLTE